MTYVNCLGNSICPYLATLFAEPDPNFKFVKNLPKHTDGFLTEEVLLECQVNSHKAIVHWYKGEDQVEVSTNIWELELKGNRFIST